jgi:hypothetical protein
VRIVPRPEGVTLYVDGSQVISAALTGPAAREQSLRLVGTFGREGSAVYFDNLVIRAPASAKQPAAVPAETPAK